MKRSSRQNSGGLRPIAETVLGALRRLGLEERFRERELLGSWNEVAGPDIAAHVRAVDIEDGVLVLAADHGAWRQEVNMLSAQILAKFEDLHGPGTIRALRWKNRPAANRRRF